MLFTLIAAAALTYEVDGHKFKVETVVKRDDVVWSFDFLPDGRIVFSERRGQMGLFDPKAKKATVLKGVPKVRAEGQGGLLDVKVHPDYVKNGWVYFTFSEPVGEKATTTLARGKIDGANLKAETLLTTKAASDAHVHYGSRINFDGKGHVFFTVGDRGERDEAQKLGSHNGALIRLKEDGRVPADNPFVKTKGALPEIYSYGHRSPQGLDRHPDTGELWEAEMGPRGGDELNLIKAGANYGWPAITYGREYGGPAIGEKAKVGMEQPVAHWVPSISPSGMAFYRGDLFPKWKGALFLGNLSGKHLRKMTVKDGKVSDERPMLEDLDQRFRMVRSGPDGSLWFSTDDGTIARLSPI